MFKGVRTSFNILIEKLYMNKNSESIAKAIHVPYPPNKTLRGIAPTKIDQLELDLIKVKISKDYIE